MNQSNQSSGIVREYVRALFQNRGKLIAYNLLIALLALAVILVWPREYKSEAKVWIKIGRENSKLDPTAATGETISIQQNDREDEIKSVIDILGSRGVVQGAVDQLGSKVVLGDEPLPGAGEGPKTNQVTQAVKFGLGKIVKLIKQIDPVDDNEEAVQEILKHIVIDAERKSNVISVQYDTDSPQLAQAVVKAVIVAYKEKHADIYKTEGSQSFFSEQLVTLDERVKDASKSLRDAKDNFGIASVEGHRTYLEKQMAGVSSARLEAAGKLAESNAQVEELTAQLRKHPQQIKSEERSIPNTGRDMIRNQLYSLQVRRMALESKMKGSNPLLEAIMKQEAEARRELADNANKERKEVSESLNDVHQALALELAKVKSAESGYEATLDELENQHDDVIAQVADLNQAEIEIQQLQRDVQLAVSNFMTYSENLEDARVDEALNQRAISNVSIAQSPTLELKPVSPSKLAVAVLALAAMLFGSLAIIAGMLVMDDSVRDQDDLEAVAEGPIVVSVPNERQYRHVLH